jgi:dihydroxyacetone kinase-like protein
MERLTCTDIKEIFSKLRQMSSEQKQHLIDLDSVMGDGDLGLTMAAVFKAADEFTSQYREDEIGSMVMKAGMMMAKAAPSTMGTLMATGFMRGGKTLKDKSEIDAADMAKFWRAFSDGIAERGKSKPGEKTIIDALDPAAAKLQEAVDGGAGLPDAMKLAYQAAIDGVEATKDMVAQHGRAAYYQERSKETQDPGATVGAMVVKVFADYLNG